MEQVTLTYVKRTDRTSTAGKPYVSISIKTTEHGDKYLSGFGNKENTNWKEGDQVEITTKEVVKDGKTYLNFETPKKEDKIDEKLEMILNRIVGMKLELAALRGLLEPKKSNYPTPQSEGIDLEVEPPF